MQYKKVVIHHLNFQSRITCPRPSEYLEIVVNFLLENCLKKPDLSDSIINYPPSFLKTYVTTLEEFSILTEPAGEV